MVKLNKKQNKPKKGAYKCNICGLPGPVDYKEKDEDTGIMKTKSHHVPCLGHIGISESFWNLHSNYNKYHIGTTK